MSLGCHWTAVNQAWWPGSARASPVVRCTRGDREPVAQPVHALMAIARDLHLLGSPAVSGGSAVAVPLAPRHRHGDHRPRRERDAVSAMPVAGPLAAHILTQRSAQGYLDDLEPPADGRQRQFARQRDAS
ncbi:hypothetical protein ADK76_26020 [Streptomyces griseoflavus]|nr:hypothetical protein ADK76_26020 [Streptomyces griseoflavus]